MNCLDYRRELAPEPRRESAEMQEHRRGCAGCSAHHARALGFELALKRALAVPVPDGLAERILLAQATNQRGGRGWWRYLGRFAAAAAAAAMFAQGLNMFDQRQRSSPLAQQLIVHREDEPAALTAQMPLPEEDVQRPFIQRGVRLAAPVPAGISYAHACPVGALGSVHMVMPEREGPVTVFFLPDHTEPRGDYIYNDMRVRAVPMAAGTLALLATDARHFDSLEASWRLSLEGSPATAAGVP